DSVLNALGGAVVLANILVEHTHGVAVRIGELGQGPIDSRCALALVADIHGVAFGGELVPTKLCDVAVLELGPKPAGPSHQGPRSGVVARHTVALQGAGLAEMEGAASTFGS